MNTKNVLVGAGIGAAAIFILNPSRGGGRRALVHDKIVRATRLTRDGLDATARDMSNRARGIAAAARGRLWNGDVSDDVLVERVRAKLGRVLLSRAPSTFWRAMASLRCGDRSSRMNCRRSSTWPAPPAVSRTSSISCSRTRAPSAFRRCRVKDALAHRASISCSATGRPRRVRSSEPASWQPVSASPRSRAAARISRAPFPPESRTRRPGPRDFMRAGP